MPDPDPPWVLRQVFVQPTFPWSDPHISACLARLLPRCTAPATGASPPPLLGLERGLDVVSLVEHALTTYTADSYGDPTFTQAPSPPHPPRPLTPPPHSHLSESHVPLAYLRAVGAPAVTHRGACAAAPRRVGRARGGRFPAAAATAAARPARRMVRGPACRICAGGEGGRGRRVREGAARGYNPSRARSPLARPPFPLSNPLHRRCSRAGSARPTTSCTASRSTTSAMSHSPRRRCFTGCSRRCRRTPRSTSAVVPIWARHPRSPAAPAR